MAETAVKERLTELWETPKSLYGWLTTVDHKELGMRYIFTAILFLVVGGLEALVMRIQLSQPNMSVITPETYNQVFSMHGITMIWWYASPILSGFSVYLVPLMIGARDMAYPRLNAFTYWAFLLSGMFLYVSWIFGQAPHAGWFAYVPYTLTRYSPGLGMDFFSAAVTFLTISTTGGAINFIVTILRMRAPGMAISRMPLLMYSTLTISLVILFALPTLTADSIFLELDRHWGTHFFGIANGGSTFLWQQLFWFFGHPWVYVIFLPATGMLSIIIPVFSRRPIVGYPFVAISTMLTGLVGFGVWLHHMFTVGMSDVAMSFFSAGSMTISIFTIVQVIAWLVTIWRGRPVATAAMYYAVGSVVMLVIGGLSGVFTGIIPVDWQVHNTYYVVGHIHYVLIGSNLFPVFAGLYFWLPKMTGRMMNEKLGKLSFWIMFIGFNVGFFPMHILGMMGMPRRIFTYQSGLGWGGWNMVVTVGAFVLGIGILVSFINFFVSMRHGALAGPNPWNADTLEWATSSPPEPFAFEHIPLVSSRHPMWDDFPKFEDPKNDRVLDQGRLSITSTWLDAEPTGLATIAEDSPWPLAMALTLFGFFMAFIFVSKGSLLAMAVLTLLIGYAWLWPKEDKEIA